MDGNNTGEVYIDNLSKVLTDTLVYVNTLESDERKAFLLELDHAFEELAAFVEDNLSDEARRDLEKQQEASND